jgi:hypothetical protein
MQRKYPFAFIGRYNFSKSLFLLNFIFILGSMPIDEKEWHKQEYWKIIIDWKIIKISPF